MEEKGRRGAPSEFRDTIARGSTEQAMLIKQDELIDLLKSLMAKLDADAGVTDTDYAATLTDLLEKVQLK